MGVEAGARPAEEVGGDGVLQDAVQPADAVGEDATPAALEEQRDDFSAVTLRFRDPAVERSFRAYHYRHSLGNVRVALVVGVALWVVWGFAFRQFLPFSVRPFDLFLRYGVFIPILITGLALSFTRVFERMWEGVVLGVALLSMGAWLFYVSQILTLPSDFGYVGLILITAFTYSLVRMRFGFVVLITVFSLVTYIPYSVLAVHIFGARTLIAAFYLLSFGFLGGVAAYRLERFTRLLFMRERQLDRERMRTDALLHNILPRDIIERLKARHATTSSGRLAEHLDEVAVLFADVVGFTRQAEKVEPEELVDALDHLFSRFDVLSDRYGLEKIKTIGDAYMAVGGAPSPHPDQAAAAAEMSLEMLEEVRRIRWPSGDPVELRIGFAIGPATAGIIGERKFAYDLWGDTVNLASRLEAHGEPGGILVPEATAERLADRYVFGPVRVVDLKGKGPTRARSLLGRS